MTDQLTPSSILIQYQGAPAALVNARHLSFLGDVRHLPPADPVVKVVAQMAYYAQLVLSGQMHGPYTDADAERFARLALIDEHELTQRRGESDTDLAVYFGVPVDQLARARHELGAVHGR